MVRPSVPLFSLSRGKARRRRPQIKQLRLLLSLSTILRLVAYNSRNNSRRLLLLNISTMAIFFTRDNFVLAFPLLAVCSTYVSNAKSAKIFAHFFFDIEQMQICTSNAVT